MSKLKQHFLKHRFCYISLGLFLFAFHQMIIALIATPIRCKMWEGKEVEVFLTPEEWRTLSGVNESLKDTEWIHYPITEGKAEKEPFFIKNKGLYQPEMNFNGNKHFLISVNSKYPYLNQYTYINNTNMFGYNTFILYDQKLQKIIVQYNEIEVYPKTPFFSGRIPCNENSITEAGELRDTYLH
ncbi:TPA: hypothetical protein ACU207_002374 [Mannheimia haemolytica]|uniref:hypothetical protein n=2 Tax=Mannheimia haemolytica TaxID=75985 RepID=UPI00059B5FF0|nr:hypothetical protein [Mannheimia haemolytica]KIX27498.1 hypothetical protein HW40_12385 [Mannheimia haemolytica]MCB4228184.1 hypothetical protein [Mannheimia haemolytica]MEE3732366.1 hypothetical protein [Mannheimia haemolytica]UQX78023.1 hypothetical protein M3710_03715 [Mannheimia haemolytica]SQE31917.1 Uncharacterised protein [Mannheimia haemolytica]